MIRLTGIVALLASGGIAFALILCHRRAEIAGDVEKVRGGRVHLRRANWGSERNIGFLSVHVRIVLGGTADASGHPTERVAWLEAPEVILRQAQEGDRLSLCGNLLYYGDQASTLCWTRYELHRGADILHEEGAGRGAVLALATLAVTGPVLLWSVAALVVALASRRRRAPPLDS